ncbi:hypothetical protein GG344DRAFT_68038 [Lentinula edodes]|nr:hypothetical protein GG344DRAFT_68038 [Lentinula edodes]
MSNTMDIDKLGFFHWQINEALNNASQVILSRFRREHLLQGSPRHSDVEFLEASKETGLMVNRLGWGASVKPGFSANSWRAADSAVQLGKHSQQLINTAGSAFSAGQRSPASILALANIHVLQMRSKSDILSFPSFFSPFLGIGLFAMIILRYILLQFNFFPTQLVDVVAS